MVERKESRRIVMLDDDDASVQLLRRIATSEGEELLATSEQGEFLEAVKEWRPHLIVVNHKLVGGKLQELIRVLVDADRHLGVVLLSEDNLANLDDLSSETENSRVQIAGVITKPVIASVARRILRFACCRPYATGDSRTLEGLARQLRWAIRNRQITVVFQPKIDCETGEIRGFEALARWCLPGAGTALPGAFIPIAEQSSGLIELLTFEVLDQALRWFKSLPEGNDLILCVNLSSLTLSDPGFVDKAAGRCEAMGIDPRAVMFELAETSTVDDPQAALEFVTRLRMKGFMAAIDDVGTGHSSFVQLARLPFSELKVDKSFIMNAAKSPKARAIIKSFVQLGHSLGLRVIGEGVEDQASLDMLKSDGCDFAQGYFIGYPMMGDRAAEWLRNRGKAQRSHMRR